MERVGHRYRSQCRPGAGAGPNGETHVPEPKWDRPTELSHLATPHGGGDDGTRTHDPLLAKQVLYQLSYVPRCLNPKRHGEWFLTDARATSQLV
jgi:hypothetical protein